MLVRFVMAQRGSHLWEAETKGNGQLPFGGLHWGHRVASADLHGQGPHTFSLGKILVSPRLRNKMKAESLQASLPITISEPGARDQASAGRARLQPEICCHPPPGSKLSGSELVAGARRGLLPGGWAASWELAARFVPRAGGYTIWVNPSLVEYQATFYLQGGPRSPGGQLILREEGDGNRAEESNRALVTFYSKKAVGGGMGLQHPGCYTSPGPIPWATWSDPRWEKEVMTKF